MAAATAKTKETTEAIEEQIPGTEQVGPGMAEEETKVAENKGETNGGYQEEQTQEKVQNSPQESLPIEKEEEKQQQFQPEKSAWEEMKDWVAKEQENSYQFTLDYLAGQQAAAKEKNERLGDYMPGEKYWPYTQEAEVKENNMESIGYKLGYYSGLSQELGDIIREGMGYNAAYKVPKVSGNGFKTIDGIEIVNDKVAGKIPVKDFQNIRNESIHNADAESITLGKYTNGKDSYIAVAGEKSTYFDLGGQWNTIQKKYNLSNDEMFEYFNKPALDDAVKAGKVIQFSHKPTLYRTSYLMKEWMYLQEKYGFSKLKHKGDVWIAE